MNVRLDHAITTVSSSVHRTTTQWLLLSAFSFTHEDLLLSLVMYSVQSLERKASFRYTTYALHRCYSSVPWCM